MRALNRLKGAPAFFQTTSFGLASTLLLLSAASQAQPPTAKPADQIAFVRLTQGQWQLWLMEGTGSNPRQLTRSPVDKHSPNWCPGNEVIRFQTSYGDTFLFELATGREHLERSSLQIDLIGPDGKPIPYRRRGTRSGIQCGDGGDFFHVDELSVPEGMPEGKAVVIQRGPSRSPALGVEIKIIDDVRDAEEMSKLRSTPGSANLERVAAGGRVAYLAKKAGATEVWSAPVEGGPAERLLSLRAKVRNLSWSPDGTSLLFDSDHEGVLQIYRLSVNGRRIQRLTDGVSPSRGAAWSLGGR